MNHPQVLKYPIATLKIMSSYIICIQDFNLVKDLFEKSEFNGRKANEMMRKHRFFKDKPQGIIRNDGEAWSTQRRFALKTLKDFGFGKKSLETSIHYEIDELMDIFKSHGGEDYIISTDFNI